MSSSYEKVRGGKLTFKGGLGPEKKIAKKKKSKPPPKAEEEGGAGNEGGEDASAKESEEVDTGTGHAPDGKKSKKYEELFPVETKRFGYVIPEKASRESALDERVKKKADRYSAGVGRLDGPGDIDGTRIGMYLSNL
ncbi:hypothetical protein R1sor_016122 [Riccia sorocarpa]|uniref:Uncharacterized protein n=1 Tax=Riccia sorocarpa TaxID=122646 RepID=A0ABD3HEI0_9MARC